MVGAIVTAITGAALAGWVIARTSAPPSGPVILISIDSLRADRLGAYGYGKARTPNIDALAAAGIVFERAYSHSPLTLPAHVALLSGRLPFETGVRGDGAVLPPKTALLPSLLRRRGFKTAGIVSSGLLGRDTGLAPGFDFFDDEMPRRGAGVAAATVRRDGSATLEVAKRWIEQQGTRFFLFLNLDMPVGQAAPAKGDPYDVGVAQADELVGKLVRLLKAQELYDRAIIVLLSDHGEGLGEHGESGHGLFLYDSTIRTPLIVKMPEAEEGGTRRNDIVQHIDLLPTVLDLMGAPRLGNLRGRSLRHLLYSDENHPAPTAVYAESLLPQQQFGWSPLYSLTSGPYRYVRAPLPELYDLVQDRRERRNLAQEEPAKLVELSAALDRVLSAVPAPRPPVMTEEDRLTVLGLPVAGPQTPQDTEPSQAAAAPPVQPAPADPKDRVALVGRLRTAGTLAAERRFREAAQIYREVLGQDAGVLAAWRGLGHALLKGAGDARESLEAFRGALRLDAEDAATILAAADCLVKLGRLEDAVRYTTVAAKLNPVAGNEALARIELREKDYAAAQRAAEAARQADPASPMPALVAGMELFEAGKYEEALPRLEEAAREAAARPVQIRDVEFHVGDALAHLRRYSEAEAKFVEELKWFPDHLGAREGLGAVLHATGRGAELPALVADLLRVVPTPEGYGAAWRISNAAGDKAAAARLRAEARKLFGEAAVRGAEPSPR